MSKRVSITLDDRVLQFVERQPLARSRFINEVLRKEELAAAYQEQANELEFQEEIAVWDVTVNDGLKD